MNSQRKRKGAYTMDTLDISLNMNELTEQELEQADKMDKASALTKSQLRNIKVNEMIMIKENEKTGEVSEVGLNQSRIKNWLRDEVKVEGHPSLGGVYIYNYTEQLWKLTEAPQATLVRAVRDVIYETKDWTAFPNNRFDSDLSKAVKDFLLEEAPLYGEYSPLKDDSRGHLIAFNNGTYNFETNEITPTTSNDYMTMKLPYDLIQPEPDEHLLANDWLEWLLGEHAITVKQLIGFCLHRSYDHIGAYALFINGQGTSNGQNGKSQVLKFIDLMLGAGTFDGVNHNTIGLSLDQLAGSDSRFMVGQIRGKLANIKDDENDTFIQYTGQLKNMSSGGMVTSDVKGKSASYFRSQTKFIMGMNQLPSFRDDSEGMRSRMIIVPFNKDLRQEQEIAMFKGDNAPFNEEQRQKYMFAPKMLGKFAWECIQEFRKAYATKKRNPFYIGEQGIDMVDRLMMNNDPLENFLQDCGYEITLDENDFIIVDTFMQDYLEYAKNNARSINNLKADLEKAGVIIRKKNGVNAQGRQKYRPIKYVLKDTGMTVNVYRGIKKLED